MMKPAAGQIAPPGALQVGVAKRDITPRMDDYDPWVDADNNGSSSPRKETPTPIEMARDV